MKVSYFTHLPEVFARLTVGWVFLESGIGKLQNLTKVTAYFESLGIPFSSIQAPFVSAVELIAGGLILAGLFTRISSLPLIGIMSVAIVTAKWEDVSDLSSLFGLSEFLYIVILSFLVVQGSNVLSIDAFLRRKA